MEQPRNLIAERGLLGALLVRNDTLFEIGALTAEDFADEGNGEIFKLIKDQIEGGRAVTAALLIHEAQDVAITGDMKVSEYLRYLEDNAPPPEARQVPAEMARTIRDMALRSRALTAIDEFKARIIAAPVSIPAMKLWQEYDASVVSMFRSTEDYGLRQLSAIGDDILAQLKKDQPLGMKLRLTPIQNLLEGLLPGDVTYIGGTPGSGKSALALQMAEDLAEDGYISLLCSPEMGARNQGARMLSSRTGISVSNILRGMVGNDEYESLWQAQEARRQASERVFIEPSANTVAVIYNKALRLKRQRGLHVLWIDHVAYLGKPERGMQVPEAYGVNLRALKQLAKELDIAVVPLVQFTAEALRDMARWPHRLPTQGDLLFTSDVDQNADNILLLHRREAMLLRNEPSADDLYKGQPYRAEWEAQCLSWEGIAEAILAKRRDGKGWGRATFGYDAKRYTFLNERPSLATVVQGLRGDREDVLL